MHNMTPLERMGHNMSVPLMGELFQDGVCDTVGKLIWQH